MARTLTDALREFDDERLIELLEARSDLCSPIPMGIAPLAAKAAQASSVHRALSCLRLPELQLAEAMVALGEPVAPEQLAQAVSASTEQIAPHVFRLATLALIYVSESGRELIAVRALSQALPHPAMLGPQLSSDPSPAEARAIVGALPEQLKDVTRSLAYAPARIQGSPSSPLAQALIKARIATTIKTAEGERLLIPRTIQLALRAGTVYREFAASPVALEPAPPERFAGGREAQALEAALESDRIAHSLGSWHADPPSVLKRGGVPQREVKRLADAAQAPIDAWKTVAHAAWVAGLVGHNGETWQITSEYPEFLTQSVDQRWADLTLAWARGNYAGTLAGTVGPGQASAPEPNRAALSASVGRSGMKVRRRHLLRLLSDFPEHLATPDILTKSLAWAFPTVPSQVLAEEAEAFVREAEALGVLVSGVPSQLGLALCGSTTLTEEDALAQVADALRSALPAPTSSILLDADLTLTVPGLPSDEVSEILGWTEVTSRGAGITAIFTSASISRGIDRGGSTEELLGALAAHSLTGVPQPLDYLIRDEQRRHGRVKVGSAHSYVTGEAEHLDRIEQASGAESLGFVRLAPEVLISSGDPGYLMGHIRKAGLAPMAADSGGISLAETPTAHMRGGPLPLELESDMAEPQFDVTATEAVNQIRQAEAGMLNNLSVTQRLLAAIAEEREIQVGIVDGRGGTQIMRVLPLSLEGGRLRAAEVEPVKAPGSEPRVDAHKGSPAAHSPTRREFTVLIHRVVLP